MRAGPSPFEDHSATALPEWIDDNGHMNLAYYVLVFDGATDVVCEAVNLGAAHRRQTRTSVFAAETHILYRAELLLGDQIRVRPQIIAADAKRIHLAHEMLCPAIFVGRISEAPYAAPRIASWQAAKGCPPCKGHRRHTGQSKRRLT